MVEFEARTVTSPSAVRLDVATRLARSDRTRLAHGRLLMAWVGRRHRSFRSASRSTSSFSSSKAGAQFGIDPGRVDSLLIMIATGLVALLLSARTSTESMHAMRAEFEHVRHRPRRLSPP